MEKARDRLLELITLANKYRDAYYNNNESLITDKEYDDLYDDRTSVKGHQKIGKNKGNAPRNNKVQNAQFEDATKGLSKDMKRRIHDKISGQGYGYHDIRNIAKDYYRGK